jgi:gliding motility-associated-like protein
MKQLYVVILLMLSLAIQAGALGYPRGERTQEIDSNIIFVENRGQWTVDFVFKTDLKRGAVFFKPNGYRVALTDPSFDFHKYKHQSGSKAMGVTPPQPPDFIDAVAYDMILDNALPDVQVVPGYARTDYRNYYLGNNPSRWKSEVPVHLGVTYQEVYQGIDLHFYGKEDHLKYDFVVRPGANPLEIQWRYEGLQEAPILRDGKLVLETGLGVVLEHAPVAWQEIDGKRKPVKIKYTLQQDCIGFKIGKYDKSHPLIIDPTIVFSTFSGGQSDNWGFTATYDKSGHLYAGGTVFGVDYPVTPGAFRMAFNFNGPQDLTVGYYSDVVITKFNPTGTALVYSTFFGGLASEQPHSMVVNDQDELIVYGITSSLDHPVLPNAYQSVYGGGSYFVENAVIFANGCDIFVARFNAAGSALLGSTFIGGTLNDGFNNALKFNYGDGARGEVQVDNQGDIYVVSSTNSSNFPATVTGATTMPGAQAAVVFKLNANMSTLLWSRYFGGAELDAGYSLELDRVGNLYIAGGTTSLALPNTANALIPNRPGGQADGFVSRLNAATGNVIRTTYIGTNQYDQVFFVKTDRFNDVYIFGQTKGVYPITPGTYFNADGGQFIHKLNPDLNSTYFSTVFGGGAVVRTNIAPTAFAVDRCQNIMLSGWGGNSNNPNMGNTGGLPTTPDAIQPTTDGSDMYFMVLGRNAATLRYATFYGGAAREHVDGGTSRFDPEGRIYQVVCAGCGTLSFPTTPGVYGPTNLSPNCNIAGIKIDFNLSIQAVADIEITVDVDSICGGAAVIFENNSVNANQFFWDLGNGETSTARNPATIYRDTGVYQIMLVAIDSICDLSDTTYITYHNTFFREVVADFEPIYTSCDGSARLQLINNSTDANQFFWDFGDGNTSRLREPVHAYGLSGLYRVRLIVRDSICDLWDTIVKMVDFNSDFTPPEVRLTPRDCYNGSFEFEMDDQEPHYQYIWRYSDGGSEEGQVPQHIFRRSGAFTVFLTVVDTVCGREFSYELEIDIIFDPFRVFIPNAFSPNGDGINEELYIGGNYCLTETHFVITSRWGEVVFETDKPFEEFWDGTFRGQKVKQDIFVYRFVARNFKQTGYLTVLF